MSSRVSFDCAVVSSLEHIPGGGGGGVFHKRKVTGVIAVLLKPNVVYSYFNQPSRMKAQSQDHKVVWVVVNSHPRLRA